VQQHPTVLPAGEPQQQPVPLLDHRKIPDGSPHGSAQRKGKRFKPKPFHHAEKNSEVGAKQNQKTPDEILRGRFSIGFSPFRAESISSEIS
jgi:hypothetical protein